MMYVRTHLGILARCFSYPTRHCAAAELQITKGVVHFYKIMTR